MKIAIDARWIFPRLSGIGLHTRELIRHLAADMPEDEAYELIFSDEAVLRDVMSDEALKTHPRMKTRRVPWSPFSPAGQVGLPRLLRQWGVDVFHSTNYMIPLLAFPRRGPGSIRCVITVHDMIPLKYPHYTPRARKTRWLWLFRALFREICRRSDTIITVSECSRRDVLDFLGTGPKGEKHVVAIPNGVDRRYLPPAREARREPVVLYVGRLDPYKNVPVLLRAFADLLQRHPAMRLRLIGPPDERYPDARELIDSLGLGEQVDWPGYLPDAELPKAYQQATMLVLPSDYEGFGLPVVEAMASGTPVVCSRAGSLPEIAGEATLMVPPGDVAALEAAMRRIIEEPGLAAELSARGLAQAALFDWHTTAARTREVYRSHGR